MKGETMTMTASDPLAATGTPMVPRRSLPSKHSVAMRVACVALIALTMTGCNFLRRLSEVGEEPKMAPVANPTQQPDYRPVTMPMPTPETAQRVPGSLWRPGARAFFRDQRASRVGDILTVTVTIDDSATLNNNSTRARNGAETLGVPNVLGFETELSGWLPRAFDAASAVSIDSDSSSGATTQAVRNESINLRVAAIVTQVLPNGNLVIHGRQETRVNFEVRELVVGGVVRREDIDFNNEVAYDRIAEARIAYGGRGVMSDLQQPRYGQQVLDIVLPF